MGCIVASVERIGEGISLSTSRAGDGVSLAVERIAAELNLSVNKLGEGVTFYEAELYSPTFEQIQETVLNGYNAIIDERIVKGFKWNDMPVWLSHENQFNYKAAYDLAVQTNGANLPVTFKFGTTIQPIYHTFTSVDELHGFYLAAMTYINDVLAAGWAEKDAIDWTPYMEVMGKSIN